MPRTRTKDTPVRPYTKVSDPRSVRALFMVIDAELPIKLVALMHDFTPVALARKVSRARPSWPDDPEARARGRALRLELMDAFASLCPAPSAHSTTTAAATQALARPQTLTKSLSRALARSLPAALSQAVSTALKEALPDGIPLELLQEAPPAAPPAPMTNAPQPTSSESTTPHEKDEHASSEATAAASADAPQSAVFLSSHATPVQVALLMAPQSQQPIDRPAAVPQPTMLRPASHHASRHMPHTHSDAAQETHVMQIVDTSNASVASQARSESA